MHAFNCYPPFFMRVLYAIIYPPYRYDVRITHSVIFYSYSLQKTLCNVSKTEFVGIHREGRGFLLVRYICLLFEIH